MDSTRERYVRVKRILTGVMVTACGLWGGIAGPGYAAELVDGVLATVDKEVILRSDIMQEIAPYILELRQQNLSREAINREVESRMRATLDQAIESKILLREATLAGLEISDEQVEARIEEIRKRYPSNEAFLKDLEEAGETMSDFRTRARKQMKAISMGMMKRRDFEKEVAISEADIAQYYADHQDEFVRPERVRFSRIFLAAGEDSTERGNVRKRAEDLRAQLLSGADFAGLAKEHSDGPEAENGGAVGWTARGDLVESLDAAIFSLPVGEITQVVETEFGFHLLKVDEIQAAENAALEDMRTKIEPMLRAERADERYRKWMAELRKRSRVRVFL